MARKYDGKHWVGIGDFDGIGGRSVGKPVAVFHSSASPLRDPQVELTLEELKARISWRQREGLAIEEEKKAEAELDR